MTETSFEQPLAVIILAAGGGTRMKSATPKVLHAIGGRPLLGHVLNTARLLSPARVVVVVRHQRDVVAEAIHALDADVEIVDQDDVPGTGRAVELAMEHLADHSGDVLVLSGDVPLLDEATLRGLVHAHRIRQAAATVLSAVLNDATGYGRIIREHADSVNADSVNSDSVARIVEQKDASPEEAAVTEINAGVYVFRTRPLRTEIVRVSINNAQKEKYLTDVVGLLREHNERVDVVTTPDSAAALGVNDRVQLAEAARLLNARTVRRWQREGVTILDPATTWIDVTATLAPDVTVLPGSYILGATTIASGAIIGPDTSLTDCEVAEDVRITRSDITLAVIAEGATVGPFSFIRAGTELAVGSKVGAFVEVKNSSIGVGSKVPHLSYIGDTTVGRGVNLGAGAITANYDDLTKHRTEIGDQVHTGSHNVFVAPVRIGEGAKTGAGAVIRKEVPAGALALSVAPQRNVEGWVDKNRPGTAAAVAAAKARSAQRADNGAQEEDG